MLTRGVLTQRARRLVGGMRHERKNLKESAEGGGSRSQRDREEHKTASRQDFNSGRTKMTTGNGTRPETSSRGRHRLVHGKPIQHVPETGHIDLKRPRSVCSTVQVASYAENGTCLGNLRMNRTAKFTSSVLLNDNHSQHGRSGN